MARVVAALMAAFLFIPGWCLAESAEYGPKLSVRLSNGSLTNLGSAGGGSNMYGGLNLQYTRFINQRFGWGVGYRMDFDFVNDFVPLHGFDLNSRWYALGQGTRTKFTTKELSGTTRDPFGIYFLAELSQRTYYLGSNPVRMPGQDQTGSFFTINGGLGGDLRLPGNWELNVEADLGLLTLAASDDRVRVSSMLLKIGFSYLW